MSQRSDHHELGAGHQEIETSSDRSFGLVFATAFALLALAAAFLVLALTRPSLLAWPNWLWTRLGLLLGAIVAPILMAVVFIAVFTPMGLIARLFAKDFLRLRRDPAAATYWLPRQDQQPTPERLRDQF